MSMALQLEVVTPDKLVVREAVDYVSCPGIEGEFGVLKDHVALLSALKIGALRYDKEGQQQFVFISGGFADVNDNVITVLAESAELAQDIDKNRAEQAQRRAEDRITQKQEGVDIIRAEAALQRALVRQSLT